MKIYINGFWGGFVENTDPNKFFVFAELFKKVFDTDKIEVSTNPDDCDVLMESVFSETTYINYKNWKYSIFFNGESIQYIFEKKYSRFQYIPKYSCILSGRFTNKSKKIVNFPLFLLYIYSNNYTQRLLNPPVIHSVPSKNICAIITNDKSGLDRNYILDKIQEKIPIDYAGKYRNNVPRVAGDYNSPEMFQFISQYKFVITFENQKQETYITEKIINGFLSNVIPIYYGSDKIHEYFNKDRFILVSNKTDEAINEAIFRIQELTENEEKYLEMVNKPIFITNSNDGRLVRNLFTIADDMKNILNL